MGLCLYCIVDLPYRLIFKRHRMLNPQNLFASLTAGPALD
jgi:hypothetical protein